MRNVGIIGAGQIGSAMARVLAESGRWSVIASRRKVHEIEHLRELGIEVTSDNREVASRSDIVILAVRPWTCSRGWRISSKVRYSYPWLRPSP